MEEIKRARKEIAKKAKLKKEINKEVNELRQLIKATLRKVERKKKNEAIELYNKIKEKYHNLARKLSRNERHKLYFECLTVYSKIKRLK